MGVTTLAGIQGQEYIGLSILTIATLPGMSLHAVLSLDKIPHVGLSSGMISKKVDNYIKTFVEACRPQRILASPN
eukprot:12385210-Ditylum_brightwellii.AAC.1